MRALGVILAAALVVRLLYFWTIKDYRIDRIPQAFTASDMNANLNWAQEIAAGDWLGVHPYHPYNDWMQKIAPKEKWYEWWGGEQVFQQAPLYPYFLASIFSLLGPQVDFAIFLQLLLGVAQCGLIYGIARRLFGSKVAAASGLIAAVYAPFIFFQGVLLRDSLLTTLELAAFYGFVRVRRTRRSTDAIFTGLSVGLAVLCKPTAALLALGFAIWMFLEKRERLEFRSALGITILGATCFVILPLVSRNLSLGLGPLSISNRAAEAMIIANAKGGHTMVLKVPDSLGAIMEKTGGRPLAVASETLKTWDGDWGNFILFQLGKIKALFASQEVDNNANFYFGLDVSPVLAACIPFSFIFPFAIIGFFARRGTGAAHAILLYFVLLLLPGLLLSTPLARYRLSFVGLCIIAAVLGVKEFYLALRQHEFGRVTLMVAALAGLIVLHQTYLSPDSDPLVKAQLVRPQEYLFVSAAFEEEQDFARAIEMMHLIERRAHERPDFEKLRRFVRKKRGELSLAWALKSATEEQGAIVRVKLADAEQDLLLAEETGSALYQVGAMFIALGEKDRGKELIDAHLAAHPDSPHREQAAQILEKYFPNEGSESAAEASQ